MRKCVVIMPVSSPGYRFSFLVKNQWMA